TEGAVPAIGPKGELYVAWSYDDKIYFDRSADQGSTWMEKDVVVAKQLKGWDFEIPEIGRANGLPITACDISEGPNRGAIYVNWSDQSNGEDDTDIWVAKSTDGGLTWADPVRVNDDPPGKHQFFTWMAVDPMTGHIYIVFYDRRNYEDARTDVYLAWSKDGGATFTNELISESPFKPNPNQFFGDYNNISAYNGTVRPIWTRQEGDTLSVWTAIIDK
ncbi:MAG: sialidase family protein, partial [Cyclobacteriaceae bacterium]